MNYLKNLVLILSTGAFIAFSTGCQKEQGCTDPAASNFNANAEEDDGSCTYPVSEETDFSLSFAANGNLVVDPGVSADNLTPANSIESGEAPTNAWFDNVTYRGAFSGTPWTNGWTLFNGYQPTPGANTMTVSGTIANGGESINWTASTTYILDGFCFVNDGGTLTIEAGTVVKGKAGQGENASALIVARGGTINANGTSDAPIVFTFDGDPLDGSTASNLRGQWGGLIILGDAPLNSSPGETAIEGIPTNEPRGIYGGSNSAHNAGTIQYISIRHGGTDIGAGNEINGLTLGGVGSGTTFDYIEVIGNADDGMECFGGEPRVKHILTAYCGDDCFDYDEGFRGFGQFWCAVQSTDGEGDRGGEHDGGTDPETAEPYAIPTIFNATYIGNGNSRTLTFRDNAGGFYNNSIFVDWNAGVDIEDLPDGEDSYKRFLNNQLSLNNNVFWNIGSGDEAYQIFTISRPE
jgi:hypothetical protein